MFLFKRCLYCALWTLLAIGVSGNAFANNYNVVEARLSCDDSKSRMVGVASSDGLALFKQHVSSNGEIVTTSIYGRIKKGKLILRGQGIWQERRPPISYEFVKPTSNLLMRELEAGVFGTKVSGDNETKCKLRIYNSVPGRLLAGQKYKLDELESENKRLQEELEKANQSEIEADAPPQIDHSTLQDARIAALEADLAKANSDLNAANQPSSDLLKMASAIAQLQDELEAKKFEVASIRNDANDEVLAVRQELSLANERLENLSLANQAKDTELTNLKNLVKEMQSNASNQTVKCDRQPKETNDANNPIVSYLEGKIDNLEEQLESCGPEITKAESSAPPSSAPTSNEKKQAVVGPAEERAVETKKAYEIGSYPEFLQNKFWVESNDNFQASGALTCSSVIENTAKNFVYTMFLEDRTKQVLVGGELNQFRDALPKLGTVGGSNLITKSNPVQFTNVVRSGTLVMTKVYEFDPESDSLTIVDGSCSNCGIERENANKRLVELGGKHFWCTGNVPD